MTHSVGLYHMTKAFLFLFVGGSASVEMVKQVSSDLLKVVKVLRRNLFSIGAPIDLRGYRMVTVE